MAKLKMKNLSVSEILETIPNMPRESLKRIIELHGENREIIKASLGLRKSILQYCNDNYKRDKELVTIAVTSDGDSLRYAYPSFRRDPELVKIALQTSPFVLEIVDASFRNDPDYVRIATNRDITAIKYAGMSIRNNYLFIRDLVLQDGEAYTYAGLTLLKSPLLAYIALTTEAIYQYPLSAHLTRMADLFKDNIRMLLEVAHVHKNADRLDDWYAAEHIIPTKYHPLFKLVLTTEFDDNAWTYVRQALLINPEPFINPDHVLRQIMRGPNDWRALAESILYEDFLKFNCEDHSTPNSEPITFELL